MRVSRGGFAVLALIEEQTGLLTFAEIDLVLDRPLAHDHRLGHRAGQDFHRLLEPFERAHLRIVARQDSRRREDLGQPAPSPTAANGPCPATAPAPRGTIAVPIDHERRQQIGLAVHEPVRGRVELERVAKPDRPLEPWPQHRRVERRVAARQHPDRDLRSIAEERMAQRPPARSDDFDDVAPGRVDVRDVGAINPRMAGCAAAARRGR